MSLHRNCSIFWHCSGHLENRIPPVFQLISGLWWTNQSYPRNMSWSSSLVILKSMSSQCFISIRMLRSTWWVILLELFSVPSVFNTLNWCGNFFLLIWCLVTKFLLIAQPVHPLLTKAFTSMYWLVSLVLSKTLMDSWFPPFFLRKMEFFFLGNCKQEIFSIALV